MVVLQLGPYPPPHGGVQTNLVAIRNYLRARGIAAPVINLTRNRRRNSDDVYYPQSARQVLRLLRQIPADIIHIHIGGLLSARLLALCAMCSLLPRRRVVLTFHSGGYPSKVAGDRIHPWSLRGLVFRRLDAVIAVNAEIGTLFARLGVAPSRIHQICPYSPVSVRDEIAVPEPLRSFCEAHSPLLTTVGLLEPEYDLPLQVRTLQALRQQLPGAGLVIVGSGSLESELRHAL
jgi:glycosyltransferase involved in cell wall biosynthesis